MSDLKINDMKWMTWNWNEWIEMNELKLMTWSEWLDMNELKSMNYYECLETNELKWTNWSESMNNLLDMMMILLTSSSKSVPNVLNIFKWKSSSRFCLVHVHFLLTSSSKKCSESSHVLNIVSCQMEIKLSLQSRAHSVDLFYLKVTESDSFFSIVNWKSSSRFSPVHFSSTTSPDRAAHGEETETLLRRVRKPLLPEKKCRFRTQERFQAWIHAFPAWCWCDWHDDVVVYEMMMWLPRWWESWPWQSSLTRTFPN